MLHAPLQFRVSGVALVVGLAVFGSTSAQAITSSSDTIAVSLNVTAACAVNAATSAQASLGQIGATAFPDQPAAWSCIVAGASAADIVNDCAVAPSGSGNWGDSTTLIPYPLFVNGTTQSAGQSGARSFPVGTSHQLFPVHAKATLSDPTKAGALQDRITEWLT